MKIPWDITYYNYAVIKTKQYKNRKITFVFSKKEEKKISDVKFKIVNFFDKI